MTDLISRLRHEAMHTGYKPTKPWDLLVEAADEIEHQQLCIRDLNGIVNEKRDEIERLRAALDRIAEYPRQRNGELSIEGARALARAALKEPT